MEPLLRGMGSIRDENFLRMRRSYNVSVRTKDGIVYTHENITNPWQYKRKVLKNPNVESAWVNK